MTRFYTLLLATSLFLPTTLYAQTDPDLRKELLDRVDKDQKSRFALIEFTKKHKLDTGDAQLTEEQNKQHEALMADLRKHDSENTTWLKSIVEKNGWPSHTLVEKDGTHAAWLLVQHADANQEFQRHCLDLMTKLPKDQVSQQDVAYLTDRVLVADGKKQLYGTQFHTVDGKLQPKPIEDEPNVDKRRTEIGLTKMAEYSKMVNEMYGSGTKK